MYKHILPVPVPLSPEFNLGPLFLLQWLAEKMYELKHQEFIYRKNTKTGFFNTRLSQLADAAEGSAVKTWREM